MAELTDEQCKQVSDLILARQKIQAVKLYREITGSDLKTAVAGVDEITAAMREEDPNNPALQPSSGCSARASVFVLGVGAIMWLVSHYA